MIIIQKKLTIAATRNNNSSILCSCMLSPLYEEWILPYFTMSDKLVLGGSLAMKALGLMNFDEKIRNPDLDFSLTEPFTSNELSNIVDFFDLRRRDRNPYNPGGKAVVNDTLLQEDLLLFMKTKKVEAEDFFEAYETKMYNVDFFNHSYLKERDYIEVIYKTHNNIEIPIKLTHPSIILSAKAKYAFDVRVGKQFKHWEDLEELFHRKNSKNLFKVLRDIEKHKQCKTDDPIDLDLDF